MAQYPAHLAREQRLADGRMVTIRPIRADDEPAERQFLRHLSAETRQLRFMKYVSAFNEQLIHFFTHIDYDRHLALVCEYRAQLVGEARYLANPDGHSCEFGVVIADDWHGSGIATLLMQALIGAAAAHGFETMEGLVLRRNAVMLSFVRELGFELEAEPREPAVVRVIRTLLPVISTGRTG
jgi:acetyltransferase